MNADLAGTGLMGSRPAEWDIQPLAWDDAIGVTLRTRMLAEVAMRYGTEDNEPGPPPTAETATVFLVAFEADGTAIACGALRTLDDEHGEVKRFFVAPDKRGSGVARALLAALEGEARSRGWTRLVLETGNRQPDAMRFYEREGYHAIPSYGYYAEWADSRCYEKALR